MNSELLESAGLTKSQARAYLALIKNGKLTPPQLAEKLGEGRTNAYMVLDKLVELGLATKSDVAKKLVYQPTNPTALERLVETKRKNALAIEKQVRDNMPQLLNFYYTYLDQPGIRFFSGRDGILRMYEDQRRTRADVYFMRSDADFNALGKDLYLHMEKRGKLGIKTYGIEPDEPDNVEYSKENDKRIGRDMRFLPQGTYTAPVNVYVYGDKTALISYSQELIGTIIESPQIASAMRQILGLVRAGAKIA
ncbi:MAG TPA: helix-turn-helix domain-containing protein [Candidatus Saccharimonadales bacterium]|nr:helix-turn-helix domain-containing protein [Candidatus Saccharimonadales bacterium]